MTKYLRKLISEGEHQKQDFKYCISDARKIAKTFSAFANSSGGTLLIGVRDNGSIAGIASDEEYYMIDSAASLYCKPSVNYTTEVHRTESKSVLEIKIPEGKDKPFLASDDNGRWRAYVRNMDQNFLANRVILNYWKIKKENKELLIEFSSAESKMIDHLKDNKFITLKQFKIASGIKHHKAEWILAKFLAAGILEYEVREDGAIYLPRDIQEK